MENKNYSVLMSVYKNENPRYLRASVESMLAQTVKPEDFVLVCDGPLTEELDQVIRDYKELYPNLFQIIRLKTNQGLGIALRTGLKKCKYDLVARMDSDDIAFPNRCERQLQAMEEHQADMCSGTILEFKEDPSQILAQRRVPQTNEEICIRAKRRNPFNHNCMFYSKKAVEEAGSYRHCPWFEDYYLWARMLQRGSRGWNLQEPILYARTGDAMYQRRGGIAYVKAMLKFKRRLKAMGFYSWKDFLISAGGHTLVCLVPNRVRKVIYEKLLRKE